MGMGEPDPDWRNLEKDPQGTFRDLLLKISYPHERLGMTSHRYNEVVNKITKPVFNSASHGAFPLEQNFNFRHVILQGLNYNFLFEEGLHNRKKNGFLSRAKADEVHEDIKGTLDTKRSYKMSAQHRHRLNKEQRHELARKGKTYSDVPAKQEDIELVRRLNQHNAYIALKSTIYDPNHVNEDGSIGGFRDYWLPENEVKIALMDAVTEVGAHWANSSELDLITAWGGAMLLMEQNEQRSGESDADYITRMLSKYSRKSFNRRSKKYEDDTSESDTDYMARIKPRGQNESDSDYRKRYITFTKCYWDECLEKG